MQGNAVHFSADGYFVTDKLLTDSWIEELSQVVDSSLQNAVRPSGKRGVLSLPLIARLAASCEIRAVVEELIGRDARCVRGIFFDKSPNANWAVPWHQDLAVALKERKEVPGFGPWSVKDGVPHAHAPTDVLTKMVTVRLDLDGSDPSNGSVKLLPGSHRQGRVSDSDIAHQAATGEIVDSVVPKGAALVMSPLVAHSSNQATSPARRRIVHLEFAAVDLPGGLEWFEQI
jgi:ectoine hydroxylase-related dioxygenase (phytanoyl-CoA dioxygenase family)